MKLKDNFMQATKELLGTGEPQTSTESEKTPSAVGQKESVLAAPVTESVRSAPPKSAGVLPFRRNEGTAPAQAGEKTCTMISEDTVVQGSIRTSGNLELYGEVCGDITSQENLRLCGKLEGNATGRDIELIAGKIKGDIIASGRVQIDENSIVLGNIHAASLVLDGKVKGELTVADALTLKSSAVVLGNLTAGHIAMVEGALIQGQVASSSADIDKAFSAPAPRA